MKVILSFVICLLSFSTAGAQQLTLVELNCENLFDTQDDSLKQDQEYLPEGTRHWTGRRYWRKLNNLAQELLSCCDDGIPDIIALCEVENDSVVRDLARRSLLRNAGYEYVVTSSPDIRGIDVALLYSPMSFAPIVNRSIRVKPLDGMRPTRDILYVAGLVNSAVDSASVAEGWGSPFDTLHVFVVHAPSRYGGERRSRPFRLQVAETLCGAIDSVRALSPQAAIVVAGDFNDYADSPSLRRLGRQQLINASAKARGRLGAKGTYRYKGDWESLDHILVSHSLKDKIENVFINDAAFLTEDERLYGGRRPRRTYNGMRYSPGYSDHLPLVARFRFGL